MKHRAIRMPRQPRQHRTLRMSSDTTDIQVGKPRHIYISRSNGHNRIIDTDCSDTLTTTITANGAYYFTTDSINNHTRHGKRVKRIIVNSNNDSNEDIYVTVTDDDSAKVTHRPGKRNMVWVSTNGQKHNRNGKHTKIRRIKLQLSSDITTEEKTMLEKSGFKIHNLITFYSSGSFKEMSKLRLFVRGLKFCFLVLKYSVLITLHQKKYRHFYC